MRYHIYKSGILFFDMLKIAIIDDEKEFLSSLDNQIKKYCSKNNIFVKVDLFDKPLNFAYFHKGFYDLIFLDIEMPLMDGITLAKQIREKDENVAIIFITNLRQLAIKGYEVNALDFLIKPINESNFTLPFKRSLRYIEKNKDDEITIKNSDGLSRIQIGDIVYVEVYSHKLLYHLLGNKVVEAPGNLSDCMEILKPYYFSRCNNSYLVNMRYVKKIVDYDLYISDYTLTISRKRKKEFLNELTEYWGI